MRRLGLTSLATVLALGAATPAPAGAAAVKRCDGIGDTVWRLRAKGVDCDDARTLSAKWMETVAAGSGGGVVRVDGLRCVRSNPPGRGRAVRCAKHRGAVVVRFRYRMP
jgi:hypothetical protein